MVEGNMSEVVLGDLPTQLAKRGCSDGEKTEIESCNFNEKDVAKRVCISPSRGNQISSSGGNVASSISNISNENRDGGLLEFGCSEGSKSSVDAVTDCNNGDCSRGKSVVICNSKVPVGDNDTMVLDHGGEADVSVNVNGLDCANDVVDSRGKIGYFDDGSLPDMDKTTNEDDEGPNNLTELMGERAISSVSSEALKEKEIRAITEILCENSSGGGCDALMGSSEKCKGKDNISLMYLDRGDTFESADIEAEFGDSLPAGTSRTVSKTDGNCPHVCKDFDGCESKASAEGTLTNITSFQNDGDNHKIHNTDDLVLSQCGPFSCTSPQESQEYIVHGLEKSKEVKEGDECAWSESTDSIKSCSCSFCTKDIIASNLSNSAYIWLDLNYQDVKGRVSAIRKIQKEANILSERSIRSNVILEQGTESSTQFSKFLPEFMYQWRPLFASMVNEWKEEGSQLEARLQTLTSLRGKCKTDMELMYGTTSEKH